LSVAAFLLSAPAASDLREIHAYIAADDPAAARRVLHELRDAMHRLAELPGLGHVRDDVVDETLRVWTVYPYLVSTGRRPGRYRSFGCSAATATCNAPRVAQRP
jgi:plasmid stabilization system protein ParE